MLLSFVFLILTGALVLKLPFATWHGISFVDALFTSTSAVCVTGLIVVDTATEFTFFGRMAIMALIQFGGLGIMTFSIGLLTMFADSISIRWRFTFQDMYSDIRHIPIRSLLKRIVFYTFTIEGTIAVILFTQFYPSIPFWKSAEHSVFLSVSAFCNAGFSTFSDNLATYRANSIVVIAIAVDVMLGGIGFIVLYELRRVFFNYLYRRKKTGLQRRRLSLHSKFALVITAFLVLGGMAVILLLEWGHNFRDMGIRERLLAAFFQSVTCRTAGFNTVDIGALRQTTQFIMIILMFIGGSPGSIAGGVKTTTFGVLTMMFIAKFKGASQVVIWGRAVENDAVERGTMLVSISMIFVLCSTFLLLVMNNLDTRCSALAAAFETVSAFATVGLSMGITTQLAVAGKLLLCAVMYVGRLGPLTLITALTINKKDINIEYPEDHIMIG